MPKTVVLIDDDSDDLDVLKEALLLVDSTMHCISFIYAEEAIRLLSKELILLPDYIFLDINMAKMSGGECLKELRKLQEFKTTPIIMCSTSMPDAVARQLIRDGATYTFQKPYAMRSYVQILEGILYNTHQHSHITLGN